MITSAAVAAGAAGAGESSQLLAVAYDVATASWSSMEIQLINSILLISLVVFLAVAAVWLPITSVGSATPSATGVTRRSSRLPKPRPAAEDRPLPGPRAIPLLGNLPHLGDAPFKQMTAWGKTYGDCFTIRMGSRPCVIVGSLELMRVALVEQGPAFAGRPDFATFQIINNGRSVAFATHSAQWKIHHKIMRSSLKTFTSGTMSDEFEHLVMTTIAHLADNLCAAGKQQKAYDPSAPIRAAMCTILYSLCFGMHTVDQDEEKRTKLADILERFGKTQMDARSADVMPWTARLLAAALGRVRAGMNEISRFVADRVAEHSDWQEHVGRPRDLLDSLISEAEKMEQQGDKHDGDLTAKDVVESIDDVMAAGMETTTNFVQWALLYMIMHPDVQHKVQAELDSKAPGDKPVTLAQRADLPYTEACILEICRHGMVAPLTLPHCTTTDTQLAGYHVPKDTLVFFNQHAISRDERLWDEPEAFRPERFLTEDGTVDRAKADRVIIFGMGYRRCLGEQVGKMQMFLFLSNLLKRCHFTPIPQHQYRLDGFMGFTWFPKPYSCIVSERQ